MQKLCWHSLLWDGPDQVTGWLCATLLLWHILDVLGLVLHLTPAAARTPAGSVPAGGRYLHVLCAVAGLTKLPAAHALTSPLLAGA